MLSILFNLDNKPYALASTNVIEVTPLTTLREIAGAPAILSGLMNYRGAPLPVIDICVASLGRSCKRHMNSRIIITNAGQTDRETYVIGLLVENVVGITRHDDEKIVSASINLDNMPHLENIYMDEETGEMVQYIDPCALLTEDIQSILSRETGQEDDIQHVS